MEHKSYNLGRTTYYCAVHSVLLEEHQECQRCMKTNHRAQATAQLRARRMPQYRPYSVGHTTYYCAVHSVLLESNQECQCCTASNYQARVTAQLGARWMLYDHAFWLKHELTQPPQSPQPRYIDPKDKPNFTNPWCYSSSESPKNTPFLPPWARLKVTGTLATGENVRVGVEVYEVRQPDELRLVQMCGLSSETVFVGPSKVLLELSGDINNLRVYRLHKLHVDESEKEEQPGA